MRTQLFRPITLLIAALLALPGGVLRAEDATTMINSSLPPKMVKSPGFPHRAKGVDSKLRTSISLKELSATKNQIIDVDEWFQRNILPRPPEPIEEDYRYIPAETRWGKLKFFRTNEENRSVAIYEEVKERPEAAKDKGFLAVYTETFNYTAVFFGPDYQPAVIYLLEEFHPGILAMNNAHLAGNLLYFDCNYNGYASLADKKTGYLVALDLESGQVLWTTGNLTAAYTGFLVYKDVILAGYGFTDEPDFLYVINRHNGKVAQKIKLKTGHDHIVAKKDRLYVRTYDTDYLFEIVEKEK